uniref:Amino acid transporter n=1 Tax=Brugia timori TaxID=42155 RepID=A0A0R3R975_9BILA
LVIFANTVNPRMVASTSAVVPMLIIFMVR